VGFGVWGCGVGVGAPTPKPQSPIPNPKSPIPYINYLIYKNKNFEFKLK